VAGVVVLAAVAVALWLVLRADDTYTASDSNSSASSASPEETTSSSSRSSTPSSSARPSSPSSPAPTGGEGVPPATVPPEGLGDDPDLDQLAQACYDGIMDACDALYLSSEDGSVYRAYGDTCAGRQPEGTTLLCTVAFPGE
jgi:hypothetical protein